LIDLPATRGEDTAIRRAASTNKPLCPSAQDVRGVYAVAALMRGVRANGGALP
jgi:hypothetical protein